MRVLAIRGKNIASLAGDFEVDFRLEPLASAGLFAICGATGSGKSTLLDVLCLALYDNTPRLHRASGRGATLPDVRDDLISHQDPRTLLRRGAAEGHSEVDFVGNDDVEYRARWSVRRARSRADGRLQASEMSLIRVRDGQPAAGSLKTEVLAAITERLGLAFEQFTRAVLLAQNEFTAFLHADDGTRAELLELLTGTETFSELSRRAFERSKEEQLKLEDLRRRVGDHQPIDADGRATLEDDAGKARAAAETLGAERDGLDAQLRWHEQLAAAADNEQQAQEKLEGADVALADVEPRRQHLVRVKATQPARSLVTDCDRTAGELSKSRDSAVPQAERDAHNKAAGLQDADSKLGQAKATFCAAEEHQRCLAPELERVRMLDLQGEDLAVRVETASKELDSAVGAEESATHAFKAATDERSRATAEREQHRAWLSTNEDRKALVEGWPRWDTLLTQAERAEEEAGADRKQLADAVAGTGKHREELSVATNAHEEAIACAKTAQNALTEAETALGVFDAQRIQADRSLADARRETLREAQQNPRKARPSPGAGRET